MPNRTAKSALLMLHWQNSVADPKGVWGKDFYPQIVKHDSIKHAQRALEAARAGAMIIIYVNIGWRAGFPELPAHQYYPLLPLNPGPLS
jgi:nicotinamidase-related amidase